MDAEGPGHLTDGFAFPEQSCGELALIFIHLLRASESNSALEGIRAADSHLATSFFAGERHAVPVVLRAEGSRAKAVLAPNFCSEGGSFAAEERGWITTCDHSEPSSRLTPETSRGVVSCPAPLLS